MLDRYKEKKQRKGNHAKRRPFVTQVLLLSITLYHKQNKLRKDCNSIRRRDPPEFTARVLNATVATLLDLAIKP